VESISFPETIKKLVEVLGAQLVAYMAGVTTTGEVGAWIRGESASDEIQNRVRLASEIAGIFDPDDCEIIPAWFQGLNPSLDYLTPATMIRNVTLATTEKIKGSLSEAAEEFVV